ncbi:MAG: thiamine diphosphokinase [Clostridiales bacterium]|jgi:thiamine pyrophosphokinase|nr:thiamine diphosphokinase [Clostridiales bacterium]
MKTLIITGGDLIFSDGYALTADYVICCDSGLRHAQILGMRPDVIVGDFDSVAPELLARYEQQGVPVVRYPAEKDYTDTELGISLALEKRAEELVIIGAGGSRFDHVLANVQCLVRLLPFKIDAKILHAGQIISLLDGVRVFEGEIGKVISLMPITWEVTGVCTKGLKYRLANETLFLGQARGVSNVFTEKTAEVRVGEGVLCVVRER